MDIRIGDEFFPAEVTDLSFKITPNPARFYGGNDLPRSLESHEITCSGTFRMSPAWAEEIRMGLWRRHREHVIFVWLLRLYCITRSN